MSCGHCWIGFNHFLFWSAAVFPDLIQPLFLLSADLVNIGLSFPLPAFIPHNGMCLRVALLV